MKGGPFRDIKKIREKNQNRKIRILSQSHSAEKLEGGNLWRQKNRKKSHIAERNSKGDPIVSSGFVSYDKNGVTERGALHYPKCAPRLPVQ